MAEFSKQYCEHHDHEFGWDFDILEVASKIENGFYLPHICEGYGFVAIGKDESGEIILAFRTQNDEVEWKPYPEVIV